MWQKMGWFFFSSKNKQNHHKWNIIFIKWMQNNWKIQNWTFRKVSTFNELSLTRRQSTMALRLTSVGITLVNFAQMLLDIKFETSTLNDPKWPWKLQRQLYFNSSRPKLQSFLLYAQSFSSAPNDLKWRWILSGQRYPIIIYPNMLL